MGFCPLRSSCRGVASECKDGSSKAKSLSLPLAWPQEPQPAATSKHCQKQNNSKRAQPVLTQWHHDKPCQSTIITKVLREKHMTNKANFSTGTVWMSMASTSPNMALVDPELGPAFPKPFHFSMDHGKPHEPVFGKGLLAVLCLRHCLRCHGVSL